MLAEAGFIAGVNKNDDAWFQIRGTRLHGTLKVRAPYVSCPKEGCIKIDLHEPNCHIKIIMMASKCLARKALSVNNYCNNCPFIIHKEPSIIASLERHTKRREDIY